jgi:hypothetical protein
VRLFTSRYRNPELADRLDLVKVQTTVGAPRWTLEYSLERSAAVTPYGAFRAGGDEWRDIYVARLEEFGIEEIRRQFAEISGRHGGRDLVLLCFEDVHREGDDACHRRAFAAWWQEQTGQVVDELPPLPADKPPVLLYGGDATAMLAACQRAARRAGWTEPQIESFTAATTAADYEHLLAVILRRFDADLNGSD